MRVRVRARAQIKLPTSFNENHNDQWDARFIFNSRNKRINIFSSVYKLFVIVRV